MSCNSQLSDYQIFKLTLWQFTSDIRTAEGQQFLCSAALAVSWWHFQHIVDINPTYSRLKQFTEMCISSETGFWICTRGVQKVRRLTQLTMRYAHHILSVNDIFSCNWNALGPGFLQNSHSVVEELLFLVFQPATCHAEITFSSSETLCPFMNSFSLKKNRSHLEPGQCTWSHVSSSTGCHPKCRHWTTPSPTVFTICIRAAGQMAGWKTKNNNSSTTDDQIWWSARLHHIWLTSASHCPTLPADSTYDLPTVTNFMYSVIIVRCSASGLLCCWPNGLEHTARQPSRSSIATTYF